MKGGGRSYGTGEDDRNESVLKERDEPWLVAKGIHATKLTTIRSRIEKRA